MTTVTEPTTPVEDSAAAERADYTSGLRKLADLLDANPSLSLPYTGARGDGLHWIELHTDVKDRAAAFARLIPGTVTKEGRGDVMNLTGTIDGLKVVMIVQRDEVCERVVIGVDEVEVTEPDPDAVAALPQVTRTVKREIVEWRCASLLGGDDAPA